MSSRKDDAVRRYLAVAFLLEATWFLVTLFVDAGNSAANSLAAQDSKSSRESAVKPNEGAIIGGPALGGRRTRPGK